MAIPIPPHTNKCIILATQPTHYLARITHSLIKKKAAPVFCPNAEQVMLRLSQIASPTLIIDHQQFPKPQVLLAAIKKYHPDTKIWKIELNDKTDRMTLNKYEDPKPRDPLHALPLVSREEISMLLGDPA